MGAELASLDFVVVRRDDDSSFWSTRSYVTAYVPETYLNGLERGMANGDDQPPRSFGRPLPKRCSPKSYSDMAATFGFHTFALG